MSKSVIFVSLLIVIITANRRALLQGGGGGGGGGGSGGGGGYSGYSSSEPSTWSYNVYINMTYEWILFNDIPLSFSYKTLWTDIKPLIKDSKNKYKIHEFDDKTSDKSDIIYNKTQQIIYEETNRTLWKQLKFEITTEYKTKLTNYLKSSDFESVLVNKINNRSMGQCLQFNTVYVTSEKVPNYVWAIVLGVIGGIFILILCSFGIFKMKSKYLKSSWSKHPNVWVNNNGIFGKNHEGENNPFVDGMYKGYYYQYGKSHPMYEFKLIFDGINGVKGSGTDTVGKYNIDGVYSINTARMQLNKTYIKWTGNRFENLGHTVKIKLEWDASKQQFIGPWYVKTYKYEGTGKWVIQPNDNVKMTNKYTSTTGLKSKYKLMVL